ncbi:pectin lyase fold/virulence factor [Lophiotrema nucula]|uniref:galacturonan 1,4-alpha-galacturonidase n=1 Tax=Lophiotrema nucula TaxID=690887 RepID=A0A6A5ZKA7_9PLEO|nr:pectin lyase fold/virulence factor [Lophiotrema nucula]
MPPVLLILPFFLALTTASHLPKRAICTVPSLADPAKDDVPAIHAALQQCGDTGRILMPLNNTYTIRSPLDLSPCRACDFQINGVLNVSDAYAYWQTQPYVIKAPNTTAAVIRSDGNTGVIDGNNCGYSAALKGASTYSRAPPLVSVLDSSYVLVFSGLTVKNVPGTAFYINNSTGIRFHSIAFEGGSSAAAVGYVVDAARHVYVWNSTIRAREGCVRVLTNSSNVQVEESTCIIDAAGSGNVDLQPSGISFYLSPSLLGRRLEWIRNVWVKSTKFVGEMDAVAFVPGGEGTVEVFNATFTDVEVGGGVKEAVRVYWEDGVKYNVSKVLLRDWTGTAKETSEFRCQADDICDFVKEGWDVVEGA